MGSEGINVRPEFVLAGESTWTVSNGAGDHYTFHVYKSKPDPKYPDPSWFVKVLVGSDNTAHSDYAYIGKLEFPFKVGLLGDKFLDTERTPALRMTKMSRWSITEVRVRVAVWALRTIWQVHRGEYILPAGYSIKHIGRCGRCGAALTTPESLDTGLGPVCAELAGVEWKERNTRQPELAGMKEEGK